MLQGIQSYIGHGQMGLRAPLRPHVELYETSAYEKQTWLECRPVKPLSGFTLETGTTWRVPCSVTYLLTVLDVVWVRTSLGRLTRRETLAQAQATQGSYFYDPDAAPASWTWDDGVSLWDGAPVWDSDPVLYVNMPGGIDPNTVIVSAQMGVFIGNFEVPQPNLSRIDDLIDGSFEDSGARGDPFANWIENFSGTNFVQAEADTVDFKDGVRSAKFTVTNGAVSGYSELQQDLNDVAVPGKVRWLSGWYKTDPSNSSTLDLTLAVGDAINSRFLTQDGRSYLSTPTYMRLPPTFGHWRRAVFCFVHPPGTGDLSVYLRFVNTGGTTVSGSAWVDGWKCRRVFRFNDYLPWLPTGGLPQLQVSRPDGYFGEWSIGLGTLQFLNHNGALNPLFTKLNWIGQEIVVRSGGRFPGQGGEEVLFDDVALSYVALPKRVDLSDTEASIPVRDQRELLKLELPLDTYGTNGLYPGVEARYNGRPIPSYYGINSNLTPTQVDIVPSGASIGLPIFDVGDNADLSEGSPQVRVFIDEDSARKQLLHRSVLLTSSEWAIESGTNNRGFRFGEYPGPIEIEVGVNDMADIEVDGNVREVLLTPGLYRLDANGDTSKGLLPHLESKLDALGFSDFQVFVDSGEYTPKISFGGTTLKLLIDSGVNKHRSVWKTLGFTGKDDLTGALSYEADTPVYTSADAASFIVRLYNVHGPHDDVSGTYTGVSGALIERQCDIAYHILRGRLGFPVEQFDLASLAACRLDATASAAADVVIGPLSQGRPGRREPLAKVLSRLESGGKFDVLLKGTIWTFTPRTDATPTDIVDLYDRDFIRGTWKTWLEDTDVYYQVRVSYGLDPSEGTWRFVEANPGTQDYVPQNHGRYESVNHETYLRNYSDVLNRLGSFVAIAIAPIRHFEFEVRGKVYDIPPGGKVRSNRTKGMTTPDGLNAPVKMRILSKIDNGESHGSRILAMTDIG